MDKTHSALLVAFVVLSVNGCKTYQATQKDEFLSALQGHVDAEVRISEAFDNLHIARAEVIATIEKIANVERRERARTLFELNEKAWGELIESETLIRQGAKTSTEKADVRYLRITEAERASLRVDQLVKLTAIIRNGFH